MGQDFESERVLVGQGRMADIYLWNGFAYKCFKPDYPDDWMEYEKKIQNEIAKTNLPVVRYYESELPHSIKMDYIDGISLSDRMRKEKYEKGLEDFISLSSQVHKIKDLDLPRLNSHLVKEIPTVDVDEESKKLAIRYISEIPDGNTLCHLDFHFLNVMYSKDQYYIIDWVCAQLGNPIYDCARSYVIMYEFADMFAQKYLDLVSKQYKFDEREMKKAIYVMAVYRLKEYNSTKVKELIHEVSLALSQTEVGK